MSQPVASLAVMLTANSQPMVQDMKQAEGALSSFTAAGEKVGASLAKLTAQGAAFGLGMLGVHGIVESMKHGFELAEQNEKAAVSFKVLLGSAEAAKDMLQEVKSFAGQSGMMFGDARAGAAGLLRMGFDKADITPMLKILGDVGATSFEGMQASMQKNIQMLGVIKDQGFLTSRNMKALAMEGIEPWEALSKAMGKSRSELKDMIEAGQIDASTGIVAILTAMQDKFSGGMQENAKTLSFQLERMKKTTAGIFADIAGIAVEMSGAESWMPAVGDAIGNFRKNLASGKIGEDIVGMLAAIGGPEAQKEVLDGYRAQREEVERLKKHTEELARAEKIRVDQMKIADGIRQTQYFGTDAQEEYRKKLQKEVDQYGMSDKEKERANIIGQAPNSLEVGTINVLANTLKGYEDQKKMMEEGKKLTEEMRLPEEKLADEVMRLTKMLDAGAISQETYNRRMESASPVLAEFMKQTKSLREEIDKLSMGEDEAMLKKLQDAGGSSEQRRQVEELLKQRNLLKENLALQGEAAKAIEDQMDPAQKLTEQYEEAKKKYLSGALNDQQFEALSNKYGKEYMSKLNNDQPRFAGADEANSRAAYSALVNAQGSTMSARDLAQKQLDQAVIQAENQKRMLEQQGASGKDIVAELKRINSFKTMSISGVN